MPAERITASEKKEEKIKRLDPRSLIKDNFAFSALDPDALIGREFKPANYNPVDFVLVRYDKGSIKERLRDGHNRTYKAAEYMDTEEGQDYVFVGRDVTKDITDENYLTPGEYLKNIVGPTKKEQLDMRMAGHLVTEWNGLVGNDVADDYPSLVALSFLTFSPMGLESPKSLSKKLSQYAELTVNETPEKRKKIESGLIQMATTIRDTKLVYEDVTHPAFKIVGKEFDQEKLRKQAKGFLGLPDVHKKIADGAKNDEQIHRFERLEELIAGEIQKPAEIRDRRALYHILTDPAISYSMISSLLTSQEKSLSIRYQNIIKLNQPERRRRGESKEVAVPRVVFEDKEKKQGINEVTKVLGDILSDITPARLTDQEKVALRTLRNKIDLLIGPAEASKSAPKKETEVRPESQAATRKEGLERNFDSVTGKIDETAKSFFPVLANKWEDIKTHLRRNNGQDKKTVGLQAVKESLTPRLIDIANKLGFDAKSDEFKFISANHYALTISGLRQKTPDSEILGNYENEMNAKLDEFWAEKSLEDKKYLRTLQFMLYAIPGSPTIKTIELLLKSRKVDSRAIDTAFGLSRVALDESNMVDIQELFNSKVLGYRNRK